MDLNTLLMGALPTLAASSNTSSNNSTAGFTEGFMESLAPLLGWQFNPLLKIFMVLHRLTGTHFGLDPTVILAIGGFAWALSKLCQQLYGTLFSLSRQYWMADIHVNSYDDIYTHLIKWLSSQPELVNSRSLTAESTYMTPWDAEDQDSDIMADHVPPDDSGIYLNFSNKEAQAPPRFIPAIGIHGFWHGGRYFRIHRKKEPVAPNGGMGGYHGSYTPTKDKEDLVISCFGRSPEPIKKLLQHAKEQYYLDHHAMTTVKRPSSQNMRRYGGHGVWTEVARRPVRPMGTVVLDAEQKVHVLSDINEYLHPMTPQWYANRGIPLRRGYLFHGPPGTGKTSLSFALAGVFGLDIFVISLLDPSLGEEDLAILFNALPRRCVVLLEDIDTAGLARRLDADEADSSDADDDDETAKKDDSNSKKKQKKTKASKDDWKVSDLARELKRHGGPSQENKGISLSGLLNAIDGVASHEGRVLIMTTNKPETLDEALIRPGRVDLQVGFTNATQEQARELFERMYEADHRVSPAHTPAKATPVESPVLVTEPSSPSLSEKDMNYVSDGSTEVEDIFEEVRAAPLAAPAIKTAAHDPKLLHQKGTKRPQLLLDVQATAATDISEKGDDSSPFTPTELSLIAVAFATKIPPNQLLSPAEIQGFLLKRKKSPRRALAEVDAWVKATVQQKANRTRLLQVQ
ncbi:BCS1 N terminal-domain-containing protein [Lasiosphaeria miniovina]|uniref:BCS1 N terminal-domain-containing protein n=1 Tax=Lasiosphaeria miniovina TaxID=1954250 RepID=A0AA40B431_9PEZI|nr:BCS1 N terminal-domain-containing protein [Lasiosphaeria miniovina]KAK0727316.1 BCS1 N terminal-domain-containing protein [Lasiosphaeria miniovina]